jgi:5-methylcytosine-specific restriction endonuclease McrA
VRFDTHLTEHPEIARVASQHGELAGSEVLRAYVIEKFARTCAYCRATEVPLQLEHVVPKARGGSDRVSNLALACKPCDQRKGI